MKQLFRNLSIGNKLFSIIMVTSASVIITATLLFIALDRLTARATLEYVVSSQASIIGRNAAAALTFYDQFEAQQILAAFENQQHIEVARLYDANKALFAEYTANEQLSSIVPSTQGLGLPQDDVLELNQDIFLDGEVVGSVYVKANLNQLVASVSKYSQIAMIVMAVSLLLAAIMSTGLQRTISRPITHIVQIAREVSHNNYKVRAEKHGDDELGELVDGINLMLDQIEERDSQLANYAKDLEQRVKDRTAELELLTSKFKHQAYHDTLTSLPNRAGFIDQLQSTLNSAINTDAEFSVLFMDLDRFKAVNDTLGHAAGDMLLIEVARRIRRILREEDIVARLGGDEFTCILPDLPIERITEISQRILEAITEPVKIADHKVYVSSSIGICRYPHDAYNLEELLKYADAAMYHAKALGRNRFHFYGDGVHNLVVQRLQLEHELQAAIANDQLHLVFQPKIHSHSQKIVGAEALIRWQHPALGLLGPEDFIPIAEETGQIISVGNWVIDTVFEHIAEWQQQSPLTLVPISLNLSGAQFSDVQLPERLEQKLQAYGLRGQQIDIELTESAVLSDPEKAIELLTTLQNLGISISLDDFGTGHASLSNLRRLPLDTVKLDQSLIEHLHEDEQGQAIVKAMVDLAHTINCSVVAEGVETQATFDYLKRIGCDAIQGYFFSKPMTASAFADKYLR